MEWMDVSSSRRGLTHPVVEGGQGIWRGLGFGTSMV